MLLHILFLITACRGGDIRKWADAAVKHVLGVDISDESVTEAAHRSVNQVLR